MNSLQQLRELCVEKNIFIATAESCTSGLLASRITSEDGSSSFFKGGIVAYENSIKIKLLGVSKSLIKEKTAVSLQVAEQMAEGARKIFLVDFSIATSGYAGPSGGTKLNPVGTVFIAVASSEIIISKRFLFEGNRQSIVDQTVVKAIDILVDTLKNH
jgi:PncC family amidohydrolase